MLAAEGGSGPDEVGRGAFEHDLAAVVTGAGAEVDDPVGMGHHRLMVLDHYDRLAGIDEAVEQTKQLRDVGEMQGQRSTRPVRRGHPFSAMWVASLSRWRSRPDNVGRGWPRVMYPSPTSTSRVRMACAAGMRASPAPKNSLASLTDMASTSLMLRPPKWYSSTEAWKRLPSQSSHGVATPAIMARSV